MGDEEFEFNLDAECGLAHYRETILSVWKGMATLSLVHAHFVLARKLVARYGRTTMLVVIEQDTPPPNAEARECIERFYAELADHITCVAQVIEGTGFLPGAARAVVSTINLIVRRKYPVKVFSETEQALPWVVEQQSKYFRNAAANAPLLAAALSRVRAGQNWHPAGQELITHRTRVVPPR